MSIRKLAPFALVLGFALAGCSTTASQEDQPEQQLPASVTTELEAALAQKMSQYGVPGAVVAVCAPSFEDWDVAAGLADVDTQTAMTADLVWPMRSVTKSYTVTLLLQLVDEGKVSLDDPISKYVDGVPNGDKITLGQLATMTSGVPEYTTQAWLDDYIADEQRAFTTPELINYAIAEPAMFKPGSRAFYVNTSTLLLGEVVESVSGEPFQDTLETKILGPLELNSTSYPTTPDDWSGPHPTGYQPGDDGQMQAQGNNFTVFGPAGAMTSTVADACRWGAALGSGELLSAATAKARPAGQPLAEGSPEYDIYGQGLGTIDGWVGHTGEGFGHSLLIMYRPETKVTTVVNMNASNLDDHVPTKYFREVVPTLNTIP